MYCATETIRRLKNDFALSLLADRETHRKQHGNKGCQMAHNQCIQGTRNKAPRP